MLRAEVERAPGSAPLPARLRLGRLPSVLIPLRDQLAGPIRQASLVLMGLVAFVLLIACANVAHLLLSRIAERRQELSIRAALGASRARLVQQLIVESMVLTGVAAAAGLGIAHWAVRLAGAAQSAQLAAQAYTVLDWRVLGFAAGIAALTGVLFGVVPACLTGRMQPSQAIMRIQHPAGASGVSRIRVALLTLQAAFTLILVAGSFTMGRSFLRLLGTGLGFQTAHAVTLNVSLAGTRHSTGNRTTQYYNLALDRLRGVPGVEEAGVADHLPLMDNKYMGGNFVLDSSHQALSVIIAASPGYFRALGTGVIAGREFTPADQQTSEPVAIVNEDFARSLDAGPALVGRKLTSGYGKEPRTIVGVVRSTRMSGPSGPGGPQVFVPLEQWPPEFVTFVARVRGDPAAFLAICRDVVQQVDSHVPVYDVKTLDARLSDNLARPRFYTTAVLFLGAFALLLAVIGIYGVASYAIAQRRHEIGVRIAVGAIPARLRLMLLRQSMLPMAAGMAIGVAGALALGKYLSHLIETAQPLGLKTCTSAALLLAAAAGVAVWHATRRIARMDPTSALRAE